MADKRVRRVGFVLLVAGLIDVAIMAVCIAKRISYSSPFNIPAVVGGILLIRGSERAAWLVQNVAAFTVASLITLFAFLPLLQPLSLTLVSLRTDPIGWLVLMVGYAGITGLLMWVVVELGHARRGRHIRWSAGGGSCLTLAILFITFVLLHGKTARYAEILAQEQVGPGYEVHVSSLVRKTGHFGTDISAYVKAWNNSEIKQISVNWRE